MLMLEADRLTAVITKVRTDRIKCAAVVTKNLGGVKGVDLDLGTAILTVRTQVLEALEVAAFTLPVTDLILDVLERRCLAKIRYGKDRGKDRLQPDIIPLLGDQVHLQEPVIRFTLNLDQIWDLCGRVDLRKVHTLGRLARTNAKAI